MVQEGQLTAGHARALVGRDDAEPLAHRIVDEALNVREVEALVQDRTRRRARLRTARKPPREGRRHPRLREGAGRLLLGLKVEIKRGSGESGELMIRYGNFDQLDYIRVRLISGGRAAEDRNPH